MVGGGGGDAGNGVYAAFIAQLLSERNRNDNAGANGANADRA